MNLHEFYNHYVTLGNARDFDGIAQLISERVTINGQPHTREDVLSSLKQFTEILPNYRWGVENLVVEGDHIAARLRNTGTPVREWLGIEPTGNSVEFTEFANYRVHEGQFVDMWFLLDVDDIRSQLKG